MLAEHLEDARPQLVAHHVVAKIDRRREPFGVGAAMAFDDEPIEAEENPTIDLAWIHLVPYRTECTASEQKSDPGRQGTAHRTAQILGKLFGGSFGSFQGDIVGEPFRDHDIHRPLADIVALDEAEIVEVRSSGLA